MSLLERRVAGLERAASGRERIRVVPGWIERDQADAWCAADQTRAASRGEQVIYIITDVT